MDKKPHAIWNVLVFFPLAYFFFIIIFVPRIIFYQLLAARTQGPAENTFQVPGLVEYLPLLNLITLVVLFILVVYSIHRLYLMTKLSSETKRTWLILILLFNFITIPVLHFKHLRK